MDRGGTPGCRLAWPGSAAQLGGLEEHPMGSRASLLYYFGSSRGGEGREAPVARLQPERGAGPAVLCQLGWAADHPVVHLRQRAAGPQSAAGDRFVPVGVLAEHAGEL